MKFQSLIAEKKLQSNWSNIHHFNKSILFKGVLDFDLQPHPGAGTLESWVMMWMPTLQGNYGPNMNTFWSVVTEIYTTGETLTKT